MTDELDKAKPDKPKKPEPRRPGSKTKRGPNKWLLRIFRGYDANNRRIYCSETFHGGSKDADERLVELLNRQKAGQPLKMYTIQRIHKAICKAAKLPSTFTLKVSRHSCASALMNDGVPLKMVSNRLGHSSIQITADVYGVTEDKRQREVSERIERLFSIGKK